MPAAVPSAIAEANGAFKKDPQRRNDDEPKIELYDETGERLEPPPHFDDLHVHWWNDAVDRLPYGVVARSDYYTFVCFVELVVEVMTIGAVNMKPANLTKFLQFAGKFGMTPADRRGIVAPKPPEKSKLAGL